MSCDLAKRPDQLTASFAYHYCKLVMSHLGMFSWEQRCAHPCVCVYVCDSSSIYLCMCMHIVHCITLYNALYLVIYL